MNAIDAAKDKQIWNSARVIRNYAAVDQLQKPEQTILQILKDRLPGMRMLDLGIGGGRTTVHFEPLAQEYVGSDYAENMVDACRARFPEADANTRFEMIDATDMKGVPDQYFDFVMFSFNGIDCVEPADREKVFREVRRVGKKGGLFAFSSHNLQYIGEMYRVKRRKSLKDFLYQFYRLALMIWYNGFPGKYKHLDHTVFRDGVEHFTLSLYYVNPAYQLRQLESLGFHHIRAFSLKTGAEIDAAQLANWPHEAWVYYLCEI
jgi:ubiquinone/menaquinone biosynthesis C-methylase UbiE